MAKTKIEVINGEEYEVITHDSGTVTKTLKMTDAQKASIQAQVDAYVDPMTLLHQKIDALTLEVQILKDLVKPK